MAFFLIDNQNQITWIKGLVITAEGIATPRGSKNPLFLEGIYEAEEPKTLAPSQREVPWSRSLLFRSNISPGVF
jgi:hypothetical protein